MAQPFTLSSQPSAHQPSNTERLGTPLSVAFIPLVPDASFGLGPRIAFRSSFLNAPHSWIGTGHFGWAITMPGTEPYNKRVRFVLDVDLRAGGMIHRRRSLYIDTNVSMSDSSSQHFAPKAIEPLFGLLLNAGVTF